MDIPDSLKVKWFDAEHAVRAAINARAVVEQEIQMILAIQPDNKKEE